MRVPIFHAYVLSVFARYFGLSLFVFSGLMVMVNLVQVMVQGIMGGFSFYFLAKSVVFLLPGIISVSSPLAFLMAVLLCLGQLSGEGEILAMRCGGFSFGQIFRPLAWTALALSMLLVLLNNWLAPASMKRSTDYTMYMASKVNRLELKPRTFQAVSDWVIFPGEVDKGAGRLKDVKLVRRVSNGASPTLITRINASGGQYFLMKEQGIRIDLRDGQFAQSDFRDDRRLMFGSFETYSTLMPFLGGQLGKRKLYPREIPTPELFRRAGALPSSEAALALRYRVEAVSRLASALAPLVFFLVGAPLGVALEKKGKATGFTASLAVIFLYYGLSLSASVMSRKHPWLYPWALFLPALLGAGAGAAAWKARIQGR